MGDHHKHLPFVQTDKWGTKGHLTESQQQAYDHFRQVVSEDNLNIAKFKIESLENVSLRYLRARSFHVDNALQLLQDSVDRKTSLNSSHWSSRTPDECAHCNVEALKKWYPHAQFGYDKFHRPVLFEHSGAVDGYAIYQMTTLEHLINYHWYSMETELNQMFENAPREPDTEPIISTCVVIDLQGFSMHHTSSVVLDHVKAMVALDNACYPEVLGKMLVINAPWLAVSAWDLVKGWLDPRTQQKVEIMKSGPEQEARLKEFIPEDQLPVNFGGRAAPLYPTHHHTEFVHVPRYGGVRKLMHLQPQQTLVLDSYALDGEIHMEVFSSDQPFPHFTDNAYPASHEHIAMGDIHKFAQSHPGCTQILKRELKNSGDKRPARYLDEYSSNSAHRHFAVIYYNTARLVTRPVTYVMSVRDDSEKEKSHETVLARVEEAIAQTSIQDNA
jgi:hypothetical protein